MIKLTRVEPESWIENMCIKLVWTLTKDQQTNSPTSWISLSRLSSLSLARLSSESLVISSSLRLDPSLSSWWVEVWYCSASADRALYWSNRSVLSFSCNTPMAVGKTMLNILYHIKNGISFFCMKIQKNYAQTHNHCKINVHHILKKKNEKNKSW